MINQEKEIFKLIKSKQAAILENLVKSSDLEAIKKTIQEFLDNNLNFTFFFLLWIMERRVSGRQKGIRKPSLDIINIRGAENTEARLLRKRFKKSLSKARISTKHI